MNEFNYYVYDGGELIAGFVSLCIAVTFAEEWRGTNTECPVPVDLVDPKTGETIDTLVNGVWENGNY